MTQTTTRRATITPLPEHVDITSAAADLIAAAGLGEAVDPDFCSLRSDADLAMLADEHLAKAAHSLLHAVHCREMLSARRAARELTREQAHIADALATRYDTVAVSLLEQGRALMCAYDEHGGEQAIALVDADGERLAAHADADGKVTRISDESRGYALVDCGALRRTDDGLFVAATEEDPDA